MESHKRRRIIRTIVAVLLITAALAVIGTLASRQRAMRPTPTITASLGVIPPSSDRAMATETPPPAPTATIVAHSTATDRAATPVAPAPCTPMPASTVDATLTNTTNRQGALTAEAGRLASLTATAYPGQDNPGSYATEHPPTPVPTVMVTKARGQRGLLSVPSPKLEQALFFSRESSVMIRLLTGDSGRRGKTWDKHRILSSVTVALTPRGAGR